MSKTLYSNMDNLDISGRRAGHEISTTDNGIAVKRVSLYGDEPTTIKYYREYPAIPAEWEAPINESGTTAYDLFIHNLDSYKPYRTITR